MSDRYSVIFEGRLMPGKQMETVKQRLKSALKIDDQGIARLFTGSPVAIRKNTDQATAEKYRHVFAAAGACCDIRREGDNDLPGAPPPAEDSAPAMGATGRSAASAPPQPPVAQVKSHSFKASDGGKMIVTNIETVPGKTVVEHFGLVSGSTIRAKHIGRDLMASLKNLVGGEIKGYTQLLKESRKQATDRMIEEARLVGANAIVNVRYSTSSVAQGAAELYAYGTAVRVE
jgi:uncharacterized protein YbjQ (UPF0145 family)